MAKSLAKMLEERKQLDKQIRDSQARERVQTRKDNTRRKIIIGALAMSHMDQHPQSNLAKTLKELIEKHVKKDRDRELLGLEPLPETPETTEQDQQENAA